MKLPYTEEFTTLISTQVLFLLLSIGCALRFSYSFYLTSSHQRLFVDSSDFFENTIPMDVVKLIQATATFNSFTGWRARSVGIG